VEKVAREPGFGVCGSVLRYYFSLICCALTYAVSDLIFGLGVARRATALRIVFVEPGSHYSGPCPRTTAHNQPT
jgi:hypothetical protein